MISNSRKAIVFIAGIAVAVGAVLVAKEYSLWILVPIPALVGLVYHLLNLESRFDSRKSVVEEYQKFSKEFDKTWAATDSPIKVSEDASDEMERHRPTLVSMLWGAALLTAVFAIPATISNGGGELNPPAKTLGDVSASLDAAKKATTITDVQKEVQAAQDHLKDARKGGLPEW